MDVAVKKLARVRRNPPKGWQPISTLPEKPTLNMVLWDGHGTGVCSVSMFYTPGIMAEIRSAKVYSHWQELERPNG